MEEKVMEFNLTTKMPNSSVLGSKKIIANFGHQSNSQY